MVFGVVSEVTLMIFNESVFDESVFGSEVFFTAVFLRTTFDSINFFCGAVCGVFALTGFGSATFCARFWSVETADDNNDSRATDRVLVAFTGFVSAPSSDLSERFLIDFLVATCRNCAEVRAEVVGLAMVFPVSFFGAREFIRVDFEDESRKASAAERVLIGGISSTRTNGDVVNEMSESRLILLQK